MRLARYIRSDAMLGRFFDVFLFEEVPAVDRIAKDVYLAEVADCDLYIGLIGSKFGNEIRRGVSATEAEYRQATKLAKTRLMFLKEVQRRDAAEERFVKLIDRSVTRKSFRDFEDLRLAVYASLVAFLEGFGYVRMSPFDLAFDTGCTLEDLDRAKIEDFVRRLRDEEKITVPKKADAKWVLTKLEALSSGGKVSNAAVLLFGKEPQRYFMSSGVKCLQYWGTKIERPVPSYLTFEGGLIEMIESAISFVMSRIDREIAVPDEKGVAGAKTELPQLAVREAIVNAVCHRDYSVHGSVQVMLFRDRLEIINPGTLPKGWTVEMLSKTHDSVSRNECLAKALNWAGFVEQSGHGTETIIDECLGSGLARPEYRPDSASFHAVIWRKGYGKKMTGSRPVQTDPKGGISRGISRGTIRSGYGDVKSLSTAQKIVLVLREGELSRKDIASVIGISSNARSVKLAIDTLLSDRMIARTEKATRSSGQKYCLTRKGKQLSEQIVLGLNDEQDDKI